MGIENRDWAPSAGRDGAAFGGGGFHWSAVNTLIVLNVVVFVAQIFTQPAGGRSPLDAWFGLIPDRALYRGELWRLLTYSFLHDTDGLLHLGFNMYLLWGFGRQVEARLGPREFTLFYLAAAIAGGVAFTLLDALFPVGPENAVSLCVGASGAVMGVLTLLALTRPHEQILLFFLLPVPLWTVAAFYAAYETYAVLVRVGGPGLLDGTAHGAHFGGLLLGFGYWKLRWNFVGAVDAVRDRLPRFSVGGLKRSVGAGPKVRLHRPEEAAEEDGDDDLERAADAALAKIHASGEKSLSRKERHTLKLYSERTKAKRR